MEYTPLAGLVDELERLTRRNATGTFFIATRANKSAQVALDNGQITSVYFYNKRGQEALELMRSIQAGKFRFQEGTILIRPVPLPPTFEVLEFLRKGGTVATVAAPQSQGTSEGGLDQKTKKLLEDSLTDAIGPMAAIICDEVFNQVKTVSEAIDRMAEEIPDTGQATRFREGVAKKLN